VMKASSAAAVTVCGRLLRMQVLTERATN
jgi:hypothetical protein